MTERDPYASLGVPRTATRAEIARAYRRLAKQHHPDAGAAPSPTMSRINEAWYTLSDPERRARWDRQHTVVAPPHWRPPATAQPMAPRARRPPPEPEAPPSVADRGWVVATGVVIIGLLIAGGMMVVSAASAPSEQTTDFRSDELSFSYPAAWAIAEGMEAEEGAPHRVIAHLATYPVDPTELCQRFEDCSFDGAGIPAGEARILITRWDRGQPPLEPDPQIMIGGAPAGREVTRLTSEVVLATWQLSPPTFPDRWIEVRAEIGGRRLDVESVLVEIAEMLDSMELAGT
jgi:hypothetical protein